MSRKNALKSVKFPILKGICEDKACKVMEFYMLVWWGTSLFPHHAIYLKLKKNMEVYMKLVLKRLLNCSDFYTSLTFICRLTSNVKRSENMPTYAQLMLVL